VENKELTGQLQRFFQEPFDLAEDADRIEAIILGLVTEYQKLRKEDNGKLEML